MEMVFRSPAALGICFVKGQELHRDGCTVRSVVVAFLGSDEGEAVLGRDTSVAIVIIDYLDAKDTSHISCAPLIGSMNIQESIATFGGRTIMQTGQELERPELVHDCWAIAVGTQLLSNDPRFCEPILLAKDRGKAITPEQYNRAVERARKRTGMRGYTIGRDWIASPHVRRPHFAIRWTGKGRGTPRLVPVKGCIVRRSELLRIPTGYKTYEDEKFPTEDDAKT